MPDKKVCRVYGIRKSHIFDKLSITIDKPSLSILRLQISINNQKNQIKCYDKIDKLGLSIDIDKLGLSIDNCSFIPMCDKLGLSINPECFLISGFVRTYLFASMTFI